MSEGSRPNLPWGIKISHSKENFERNIELLEILKKDDSEYVRKSIANHMNDISHYNPKLVVKTLKAWQKIDTKEMKWIIKHALRTLLKQGNKEALTLLGYSPKSKFKVSNLKISKKSIREGDDFELSFLFKNTNLSLIHI